MTNSVKWAPGWLLQGTVCVDCRKPFVSRARTVRGGATPRGIVCAPCLDRPVVLRVTAPSRAARHLVADLAYDHGLTLRPLAGGFELDIPREKVGIVRTELDGFPLFWEILEP